MSILSNLNGKTDLKELSIAQCNVLCAEIREALMSYVAKTGGHLASNLGVVELTVAIHRVFDVYTDRLVFDVGHQCYVHKMLTGRLDDMKSIRAFGGISGFPKPHESETDAFIGGHASNSISVALGMARARTLAGADYKVLCMIGDGALTGGLAYEGMNNAGLSGEPIVMILNDNGMSITKNVGAVARLLAHERVKPAYYSFKKAYRKLMNKIPGGKHIYAFTHAVKTMLKHAILHCSMFEEMGFRYFGPVDGHDIEKLTFFLGLAAKAREPSLVHVVTKKGRGYVPAERNPGAYHSIEAFDPVTGIEGCEKKRGFSSVFGEAMISAAEKDKSICAITAAMPSGTGLEAFSRKYPERFFDEGIAEGHAAAMAAGMAKQGMIPVFAVYSTFLQRAYDMLIHDAAILGLHVVLAVDRAGLVGGDGETHQGVFDVGFLAQIPGMTVYSPASFSELEFYLDKALYHTDGPVALRYPRGAEGEYKGLHGDALIREGRDVTIVSYGIMINEALGAAEYLEKMGISPEIVKLGSIAPIDYQLILRSCSKTGKLAVIEDSIPAGSVGERIAAELSVRGMGKVKALLKNTGAIFIPNGSVPELLKKLRLDAFSVAEDINNYFFGA